MSLYQELSLIDNPKYAAFWEWFSLRSQEFYETLRKAERVEEDLISELGPRIEELDLGLFFLIGMDEHNAAELIFTPDGNIRKVYLAEEIVAVAPEIPNWKFKALKPPTKLPSFEIRMMDMVFSKENISFYANKQPNYPDEIDLTMIYQHFNPEMQEEISNGVYIFLDNFLGEETMMERIDRMEVRGPGTDIPEEIPVEKLPEYLNWREKEFVEKYQEVMFPSQEERFAGFEATLEDGTPIVSTINLSALEWEYKVSHPWILVFVIEFEETNDIGLPSESEYQIMEEIDNKAYQLLPPLEGNIYLGRELGDGHCDIFFACKDYRMASKVADWLMEDYEGKINLSPELFKDKYWQFMERFNL